MPRSTVKTTGTKGKTARSRSEALSVRVARTSSKNITAAEHSDTVDLNEASRRSLESFVEANLAIMNGMNALNAEMAAFGGKRLNANFERSQSLMGCEDAEKALRVQSEFFESAIRQYLEQTRNVMEIMASISSGVWSALDQRAQETMRGLTETGSGKIG